MNNYDDDYNINENEEQQQGSSLLDKGIETADNVKQISNIVSKSKTAADATTAATAATGATGTAAATGAAATTGATAAAAGGGAAAAGGTAALAPVLGYIALALGIIILIIIIVVVINSVVQSYSYTYGVKEEELFTNEKYINKTYEELSVQLKEQNLCKGVDIFDKIKIWWEDKTPKFDSLCEGLRVIDNNIEFFEKKYESSNLQLSRGLIVSTLIHAFNSGLIELGDDMLLDDSRPLQVLEYIFTSNKFVTKKDLKELIEYMIFYEHYTYYEWKVADSDRVIEKDSEGNIIKVTNSWSCVPVEHDFQYMSYIKYFINLRYGEDGDFYYAGKTTTLINEINNLSRTTYAENGFEYAKNQFDRWLQTPLWCVDKNVSPPVKSSTDKEINKIKSNYNALSLKDYKKNYDKDLIDNFYNYYQYADYQDLLTDEIFLPVYQKGPHELDYRNGFIYSKFLNFTNENHEYDSKYNPKDVELTINTIDENEDTLNEILGYKIIEEESVYPGGEGYQDGDIEINGEWPYFPAGIKPGITTGSKSNAVLGCRCLKDSNGNRTVPDFHAAVDLKVPGGTPVYSPLDGVVIQFSANGSGGCGDIVHVKVTIPGTSTAVVLNYTHLTPGSGIKSGTNVKANHTVIGTVWHEKTSCSSGAHLDLKIYRYEKPQYYYNPVVFTRELLAGSTNIPYSTYYRGYLGKTDAQGYDSSCASYCK